MSGVEVTKEQKENQVHLCESCMNTVVQTFSHMQNQIARLKQENLKLQMDLEQLKNSKNNF
ncbi:MAG: hypothetical protein NUK63_08915 [Candidatus Bathyarchaeum tardum]|nr:MAG: hypothetical protein NUK63_08915 [Candidatus Bathyarchaeum tardum]